MILKEALEWLKALIFAAIFVFILNFFIGSTTVINTSMVPTLLEGDLLIIDKISEIKRFDIISFKTDIKITDNDLKSINPIRRLLINKNSTKNLIKRVIALPGDQLSITNGHVYVNGERVYENYVNVDTFGDIYYAKIPEGKLFVMGDNRAVSLDSRSAEIGLVDISDSIGITRLRVFPLNRIKVF